MPPFLPCSGSPYPSSLGSSYGIRRTAPIPALQAPRTSALSQALPNLLTHFFGLQRCPMLPFSSNLIPCCSCLPQHQSFSLTNSPKHHSLAFSVTILQHQSSFSHCHPTKLSLRTILSGLLLFLKTLTSRQCVTQGHLFVDILSLEPALLSLVALLFPLLLPLLCLFCRIPLVTFIVYEWEGKSTYFLLET